jgi:hypothetical protein
MVQGLCSRPFGQKALSKGLEPFPRWCKSLGITIAGSLLFTEIFDGHADPNMICFSIAYQLQLKGIDFNTLYMGLSQCHI